MGYLPQFENDVFVSYRRVADESESKWVTTLCDELRRRLSELVGTGIQKTDSEWWLDKEQLGIGPWRPELAEALNKAAIFLAVISRTYLDSDECRKELDQFLGRVKDPSLGKQLKIVPVLKQPFRDGQKPPRELSASQRYEFYYFDPKGSHRFRELGPDSQDEDRRRYREVFARLEMDLMNALEELAGVARQSTRGKVFLAAVSPELKDSRDRLRCDLQQRGYLVVPEYDYFWNSDDFKETLLEDLEGACLCISLVARTASNEPMATKQARVQLELAQEVMMRKGRPAPMVWIEPASATDASAAELLDYIEQDLANKGVEYWERGLEDFKTQIYAALQGGDVPPPVAVQAASGSVGPTSKTPTVAMLVEQEEVGALGPLYDKLAGTFKYQPQLIKFAGRNPLDEQRLTQVLAKSERCLIFWGKQTEGWLQDVLDYMADAPHVERQRLGVYVTEPASAEKQVFQSPTLQIIRALDGADDAALSAFVGNTSGSRYVS